MSLDEFYLNPDLNPAVHIAAGCDCVVVDKFYGMTDESHIFRISMGKYSYHIFLGGNLPDCE